MSDDFQQIFQKWAWKPIRNCPGRYIFAAGTSPLTVSELAETGAAASEHQTELVPDKVFVLKFAGGGGLISYRKGEREFLHTLNDAKGFARKLIQLGIKL